MDGRHCAEGRGETGLKQEPANRSHKRAGSETFRLMPWAHVTKMITIEVTVKCRMNEYKNILSHVTV